MLRYFVLLIFDLGLLYIPIQALALPTITIVKHLPLHPADNAPVMFQVHATSESGIQEVKLELFEYHLSQSAKGDRIAERRQGGVWGVADLKLYSGENYIDYSFQYDKGFMAGSQIEYNIIVTDKDGTSSRKITFQAGASPFGNREVLLYSAATGSLSGVVRLCFIPDNLSYRKKNNVFLHDLETTLYESILVNNMVAPYSEYWAFYYSPIDADADDKRIPTSLKQSSMDNFAFIHKRKKFRDSRKGRSFSSEFNSRGTVMHELGHAVFGLSDEYRASSSANEACNVFLKEEDCMKENGGNPCRSFKRKDDKVRYSIERELPNCVMNSDGDRTPQSYQDRCRECITRICQRLKFKAVADIARNFSNILASNDRPEVLFISLNFTQDKQNIVVSQIGKGQPSMNNTTSSNYVLEALDNDGKVIYEVSVDDPRVTIIDDGKKSGVIVSREGSIDIRVPNDMKIKKLRLKSKSSSQATGPELRIGELIRFNSMQ